MKRCHSRLSLKFCPNCGNELEPNATFCHSCGAELKTKKQVPETGTIPISTEAPAKPKVSPETVEYAGFIARLIALIIDSIIIGIIGSTLSFIIFAPWIPFNIFDPFGGWWSISFPFDWLLGFLYHWGLEAHNSGQTVGKMALKIRTVDEKTLGLATSGNYAVNNLFKSSPFLILDLIIGVIKNSGDPKQRLRIMQNASETVVIVSR
ncbi:MAG: RDD family protein [Promethearchaeota archaeon]